MNTIVKATGAAEFLSLVPSLLGYVPTQSVVIVPLAGGRSIGAMRLDLPPDDIAESVGSSIVGMVCRIDRADAALAVIYTDAGITGILPHATLAAALARAADASGIALRDILTVAADGWGSHLDPNLPEGGYPLSDLRTRPPAGAPVARGDQATGAKLPRRSAAARREVDTALQSLGAALAVLCGIPSVGDPPERIDPSALQVACELDDLPQLFEDALTWDAGTLAPMRAATLAWCLARPALRDVALVQWASDMTGGDVAFEAQRQWEDGAEYPGDLAGIMWGEAPRPDPDRLAAALELTRHVAAVTPKAQRPGALAMCAWLSWAMGLSTHAERYARMALRIDPHHGLSEIIVSFVLAGHLPDWAFHR